MELTIKKPVLNQVTTKTIFGKAAEQVLLANGFAEIYPNQHTTTYRHESLPIFIHIDSNWPNEMQPFHYEISFSKSLRFNEKKGGCHLLCFPDDADWVDPLQAIEEASDQLHKALVLALKIEQEFKNIQEATDIMEDDRL